VALLFVMDTDGVVHALRREQRARKWKQGFRVPDKNDSIFGGGVSFDSGSVYITTGLGEVAALDATDGKIKWQVKPAGPLRGAPTVAFGAVYVMTQDNQIIALNTADGTNLWNSRPRSRRAACSAWRRPRPGRAP
jgi:outer membrane protein assembly factor BamB